MASLYNCPEDCPTYNHHCVLTYSGHNWLIHRVWRDKYGGQTVMLRHMHLRGCFVSINLSALDWVSYHAACEEYQNYNAVAYQQRANAQKGLH